MKRNIRSVIAFVSLTAFSFFTSISIAQAQYFGKNKAHYENFDFSVYQSPHFDIYHYLENEEFLNFLAQRCEQWYDMHQDVLLDTFNARNPVIFYNDHADFQQTTVIGGEISVGTGGVTEGLKNRVVMPVTESNEQTDHVLGHELVHAFQYHMIIHGDSTSLSSLQYLPLWLVEGMAEYMSLGRVDANTAMWMRDAVANDQLPTIKQLSNPKYFPYRYGQAFWAFVAGEYGDDIIEPFFVLTAKEGIENAIEKILLTTEKELSDRWKNALKEHFGSFKNEHSDRPPGKELANSKNSGDMNMSPVISPDGKYLIYLSEKALFSLDLFLADAKTGKTIRKVSSSVKDGHIDALNFLESAGTWSHDSKRFAYVVFSKGKNKLVIKDAFSGKTEREIAVPGLESFSNPAWSPDGHSIVMTGLKHGQSDLYQYHLKSKRVSQLTNDKYSDLHPKWSNDGQQIIFSTDRLSMDHGKIEGKWFNNIAILNVETREVENIDLFRGADNMNPEFSSDNRRIYFLSNRDGFRNIYEYSIDSASVKQLTNIYTGVSGITPLSPAMSISVKNDAMVYSVYQNGKYSIFKARPSAFEPVSVGMDDVTFEAGTLPPLLGLKNDIVGNNLRGTTPDSTLSQSDFKAIPFKSQFKLDYIGGSTGVAIGTGSFGGTGIVGGVDMLFSDILGRNQVFTSFVLNGEIQDFGGQVAYINRKKRLAWGVGVSHIPYRSGSLFYGGLDSLSIDGGGKIEVEKTFLNIQRTFEDKLNVFAHYPFSKTTRIEFGTSLALYNNSLKRTTTYYFEGQPIQEEREKLTAPPGYNLGNINFALVGDNSYFGLASPLKGYRYRVGVEQYIGDINFQTFLADYRKYFYLNPFSVGFRALHYGRYGRDSEALSPLFVGNSIFVRGYNLNRVFDQNDLSVNQLVGSKIFISNFEIRIPFTGPEKLALMKSNFLFTELALFVDGGMAWNDFTEFGSDPEGNLISRKPVFSTGVSIRVNLFGAMIIEPYYAFPLQKNHSGVFGINIIPGW